MCPVQDVSLGERLGGSPRPLSIVCVSSYRKRQPRVSRRRAGAPSLGHSIAGQRSMTTMMPAARALAAASWLTHAELHSTRREHRGEWRPPPLARPGRTRGRHRRSRAVPLHPECPTTVCPWIAWPASPGLTGVTVKPWRSRNPMTPLDGRSGLADAPTRATRVYRGQDLADVRVRRRRRMVVGREAHQGELPSSRRCSRASARLITVVYIHINSLLKFDHFATVNLPKRVAFGHNFGSQV